MQQMSTIGVRELSKAASKIVRMLGGRIFGAVGVLAFSANLSVAHSAYEVKGQIKFHHYQDPGPKTYLFSMVVDGCRWRILATNDNTAAFDFQEICWDERQLYQLVSLQTQVKQASKVSSESPASNVGLGFVSADEILHDITVHEIGPLWLAFGSACYLSKTVSGGGMEPVVCYGLGAVGNHNFWKNPFKQTAYWRASASPPFLPEEILFLDDGILRHPSKPVVLGRRLPPFDRGFTNVIYRVLQRTNIGTYELPSKSSLSIYFPNADGLLGVLAEYEISLNSAELIQAQGDFVPQFFGRTIVSEGRFPELGFWAYEVTNAIWPSKAVVEKSSGYRNQLNLLRNAQPAIQASPARRITILALFGLLGAVPVVCMLVRVLKQRKQTSNPQGLIIL